MKNILLLFVLLAFSAGLSAQGNIGINDQNPDPLAILDIESTTKGVLIPRMTEADRNAYRRHGCTKRLARISNRRQRRLLVLQRYCMGKTRRKQRQDRGL